VSKPRSEEALRLDTLAALRILDTPPQEEYDRIVRSAQTLLHSPIGVFGLIDQARHWFKARRGLNIDEIPRAISFCAHVLDADAPIVVSDARLDPRFQSNPLVIGSPGVRFYASAPVRVSGRIVGALACMDTAPRPGLRADVEILEFLGEVIAAALTHGRTASYSSASVVTLAMPTTPRKAHKPPLGETSAVPESVPNIVNTLARVGAAYASRGDRCATILAQFLESKIRAGHNFTETEIRALTVGLESFEHTLDLPDRARLLRFPMPRRPRFEYTRLSPECE
jgi:hypothetical protein